VEGKKSIPSAAIVFIEDLTFLVSIAMVASSTYIIFESSGPGACDCFPSAAFSVQDPGSSIVFSLRCFFDIAKIDQQNRTETVSRRLMA